jgi:hypothetical protein
MPTQQSSAVQRTYLGGLIIVALDKVIEARKQTDALGAAEREDLELAWFRLKSLEQSLRDSAERPEESKPPF